MIRTFAIHIPVPEGDPPKAFILIHKGVNESENGPYVFDDIAAKSVMQGYKRRGVECMFDWHHASLNDKAPDPRQAIKSAGWYSLKVKNGDLWATNIKWNEDALEDFAAKRIRYFSPAFDCDKSGRVLEYINCALTNLPATHDNESLVAAARRFERETPMTEEERKASEEMKKTLEEMRKAHETTAKKLEKLEAKHEKLLKRMEETSEEEETYEEEEEEGRHEETSEEEEEGRHEEGNLPPPKAPKGDHPEPDGDEPDGDEGEDEDEDEDEETRRMKKHTSVKSRASLNKEIVRLTMENQKLRGVTTGKDLVTQIKTAVSKGIITKTQMSWARSNPKAFRKLCSQSKGHTAAYVPPSQEGTATRRLSTTEKEHCERMGIKEEDYTRSLQTRPIGTPLKTSQWSK
jgi:phage I-like protein